MKIEMKTNNSWVTEYSIHSETRYHNDSKLLKYIYLYKLIAKLSESIDILIKLENL